MGESKRNPVTITSSGKGRFPPDFIREYESRICVDWAVAFERVTGWPVHVIHVAKIPLRAYAEDQGTWTYDIRGMNAPQAFSEEVVKLLMPAMRQRSWPDEAFEGGGIKVATACCGIEGLGEYGLSPVETSVAECETVIRNNTAYLACVPARPKPWLPARSLSRYSFNGCVTYAEALSRLTGLPAATMEVLRLDPNVELRGGPGIHAVVVHPDGELEDVWGKMPARYIAPRYGMLQWRLSHDKHIAMMEEAYRVRPSVNDDIDEAKQLIEKYRGSP